MKYCKKTLCILSAVIFMLAAVPFAGVQAAEVIKSGSCGEKMIWRLDADGTLAISGEGSMHHFSYEGAAPWYSERAKIKALVIEDGVTSISANAFVNCTTLECAEIPSSVTEIFAYAFQNCTSLVSVAVPDTVTTIGRYAFSGCSSLAEFSLPHGITEISQGTFQNCTSLASICIPANVTTLGHSAFAGCTSLASIQTDAANAKYASVDGVLYNKALTTLLAYPAGKADASFTIPEKVTRIEEYSFKGCRFLETVIPNERLWSIGFAAFEDCLSLSDITFPTGLRSIDCHTFENCISLVRIHIPAATNIGTFVFTNCQSLEKITVDENHSTFASVDGVMYNKQKSILLYYPLGKKDTSFRVPDGVAVIDDSAFSAASILTDITFPDSVIRIRQSAFADCKNLERVTFSADSRLDTIEPYAFQNCQSLSEVTFGENSLLKTIGNYAFQNCRSLANITLPSLVENIGSYAFNNTAYFNDHVNWENGVMYMGNCLIDARYLSDNTYTVKDGTKIIADNAFYWRTFLKTVTIPDDVTHIGSQAFFDCYSLAEVIFEENSHLQSIGSRAFADCESLANFVLPDSVMSFCADVIENTAYYNDQSHWDNKVLYMGRHLVAAQRDLSEEYVIREGTQSIDSFAFYSCTSLTRVTIPDSVTRIGSSAFERCTSLENVNIPDHVVSIGSDAFYDCSSLANISLPDSVTGIGAMAFYNTAHYNDQKNWDGDVLYIGNHLIRAQDSIYGDYVIRESTKTIAASAFYYRQISSVVIPASMVNIGSQVFDACDTLRDVYYAGSEEQWTAIDIASNNEFLFNASVIYNYEIKSSAIDTDAVFEIQNSRLVCLTGTTAGELCTLAGSGLLIDKEDNELTGNDKVGTGSVFVPDLHDAYYEIIVPGDLDGDGVITSADARNVLRNSVGLDVLTALQIKAADIDGDGDIASADARSILRASVALDDPGSWLAKFRSE